MKYLHLIFTSLVLLLCSSYGIAAEPSTGNSEGKGKVSIIGHTGQDPVYKSIAGKKQFKEPEYKSILTRKILQVEEITGLLLGSIETPQRDIQIDSILWLEPLEEIGFHTGVQYNTTQVHLPSHSAFGIPTPPAYLLAIAGFFTGRRRRA